MGASPTTIEGDLKEALCASSPEDLATQANLPIDHPLIRMAKIGKALLGCA